MDFLRLRDGFPESGLGLLVSGKDRHRPVPLEKREALMRRKTGLLAAGTALVMMIGASGAAIASASDSGTSTKGPAQVSHSATEKPVKDILGPIAKREGVSRTRLEQAVRHIMPLIAARSTKVEDPAVVRQFAQTLGVHTLQARRIIKEVFVSLLPAAPPGVTISVFSLAKVLHVSVAKARIAMDGLERISRTHGSVDPFSKDFAALAKQVGVTPRQLADGLRELKLGGAKDGGR
jgi:hypothetical protein